MHPPELLSPAGDWDALKSAVANGADAVYFGLDTFNARQRAHNFTLEELPEVMAYLHRHNVRGFVTFNVLIFSDELEAAANYIRACADAGVDALIVQDLGIVRLMRKLAPKLEIHGSTQMTLTEPKGIDFVHALGVERVVVARELSLSDIAKIRAATAVPLEVFVHGALCVAYSGQCLTSESLGGRSANRGQCAQACRLPYDLIVDGQKRDLADIAYLVSPQDLAAHDLIGELTKLGVVSFKIEGRLKHANYVAATAQTYRRAIDDAVKGQAFRITNEERGALEQVFSRGLANGFLDGVNHQKLVKGRSPKKRGRLVGTLAYTSMRQFVIDLASGVAPDILQPGDGIVFDSAKPQEKEPGGRIYHVHHDPRKNRLTIDLGNADAHPRDVTPQSIIWKTDDPQLNKRLEQSWSRDRVVHRTPLDLLAFAHVGQFAKLTATSGTHCVTVESEAPLDAAEKFPITRDHLQRQFDKLKDTPFELRHVTLDTDAKSMLNNKMIDQLRRQLVDKLNDARHQSHRVIDINPDALSQLRADISRTVQEPPTAQPRLHVLARTVEHVHELVKLKDQIDWIYADFEDVRRYPLAVEACNQAGVKIAVATMRVIKPGEEGWLNQVLLSKPDAILVRNLAAIGFYKQMAPSLPLVGDFSLNVANELTAQVYEEAGLLRMVASYDLNWPQMKAMFARSRPSLFECVIHQHMPMFHMEHCVFAHTLSTGADYRTCGRPCETHTVSLRDRYDKAHPLVPDAGCRNTLFNADAQSAIEFIPRMLEAGIRDFRVELLRQPANEVAGIVKTYVDVLTGAAQPKQAVRSLKVVQQLGVTKGTLVHE
jgi:U32 family peptidase